MSSTGSPSSRPPSRPLRPSRASLVAVALATIIVLAGCTGGPAAGDDPTTVKSTAPTTTTQTDTSTLSTNVSTTEPHTHKGTSHAGTHLTVDAVADNLTVEIRLFEGGASGEPVFDETYSWDYGDEADLTATVHELDPASVEIIVNGTHVWNGTIQEYEMYRVSVNETAASVEYSVV